MLYPLWTAKPGSGCTTTAVALAVVLADRGRGEVLIVDLGGDMDAALGLPAASAGVTDWLAADASTPEALGRLEVHAGLDGVSLLPFGSGELWSDRRAAELIELLRLEERNVVVDVSTLMAGSSLPLHRLRAQLATEDRSVLITRACYLALRRAIGLSMRPDRIAVIRERGRSLANFDLSDVLGGSVVAEIDHDESVARAVDAGVLVHRCPRPLLHQAKRLVR